MAVIVIVAMVMNRIARSAAAPCQPGSYERERWGNTWAGVKARRQLSGNPGWFDGAADPRRISSPSRWRPPFRLPTHIGK
jgi:hypothetical protein